jgi:hypothetical protein
MSKFTLQKDVVVKGFEGYGAQMNQNVFAQITHDLGVTDDQLTELPPHVLRLAPRFVRIFFDPRALPGAHPMSHDLMQSFVRTVKLAQSAATSINITWTGGGAVDPEVPMKSFANVLADLVQKDGATKLRWVTVGNEPNSTSISLDDYTKLYQKLRDNLERRGVADQIRLMGGDLVQTGQKKWCHHLAESMSGLLDAWSIHIYWKYDALGPGNKTKLVKRLTDVREIWKGCNEGQRKPLYVTEYGVQGTWKVQREVVQPDGTKKLKWVIVKPEPGTYEPHGPNLDGPRVVDQNINAFQHAWFNILAANLGYRGLVKWDAYFAKYDLNPKQQHPQEYGMIGKPNDSGWQLRHSYHLTRLFTQTVKPGWNVRKVAPDPGTGTQMVAAYSAPSGGGLTLIGLDTAGANLNKAVPDERSYQLANLPKHKRLELLYWNRHGGGLLTSAGTVDTGNAGSLTVKAPLHGVFAVTTVPVDA